MDRVLFCLTEQTTSSNPNDPSPDELGGSRLGGPAWGDYSEAVLSTRGLSRTRLARPLRVTLLLCPCAQASSRPTQTACLVSITEECVRDTKFLHCFQLRPLTLLLQSPGLLSSLSSALQAFESLQFHGLLYLNMNSNKFPNDDVKSNPSYAPILNGKLAWQEKRNLGGGWRAQDGRGKKGQGGDRPTKGREQGAGWTYHRP